MIVNSSPASAVKPGIMKDISLGDGIEHVDYMAIGKLSEQGAVFSLQIVNSLRNENWDFDQYGDPEIVMMTVKEGVWRRWTKTLTSLGFDRGLRIGWARKFKIISKNPSEADTIIWNPSFSKELT
jgi:hypothetical protein